MNNPAYMVVGIWRTKKERYGWYTDPRFTDSSVTNAIEWLKGHRGRKPIQIQVLKIEEPRQQGAFGIVGKPKIERFVTYKKSSPIKWQHDYPRYGLTPDLKGTKLGFWMSTGNSQTTEES